MNKTKKFIYKTPFFFLNREELQSNQITTDNISDIIDALQIVKKEQNELINILDNEERQIEEELKECNKNLLFLNKKNN